MFRRTVNPEERAQVLNLLSRWSHAIARIDKATDAMRLTIAEQPSGMQSGEFEEARLGALVVFDVVRRETQDPGFWPILYDKNGAKILLDFQKNLEESHNHQLNQLRLLGAAAEAFRSGREQDSPTSKEMMSSNKAFAKALDQMGATGSQLARHYRITGQDYQVDLRK